MASVVLRVDDLERGDVPAVSVKTGRPCANPVAIPLRPGGRPWAPGRGARVIAVLPVEPARVRERRWLQRANLVVLAAALGALAAAALGGAGVIALIVAATLAVVYGVVVLVGDARWVSAAEAPEPGTITVRRVHDAFARAAQN
jgi:hypothetical protein